jgi:sulfide:quinone oxidoreductase
MGGKTLILGGGFGGLEVATRLRNVLDESHEITLVDRKDYFSMGFTKFDLMFGRRQPEGCKSYYSRLEQQGIRFLQAEIESIDPEACQVTSSAGVLAADYLVVGLGVELAPEATPGFRESGGHTFYTFEGAQALYPVVQDFAAGRIVISIFDKPYQCPPAPYEGAFQLHHLFVERGIRDAVQIDMLIPGPKPLPVSDTVSEQIESLLSTRQIGLHKKHKVVEVDSDASEAITADGHRVPFDLFIGVPVHRPPAVVRSSALGEKGWIRVDPSTMRTRFDRVWALGDVVHIPVGELAVPKAGAFAEDAAATVASDILRTMHGAGDVGAFRAQGACYFEFGGGKVAKIEANFLEQASPQVELSGPSLEYRPDKYEFETSRLARWFGT